MSRKTLQFFICLVSFFQTRLHLAKFISLLLDKLQFRKKSITLPFFFRNFSALHASLLLTFVLVFKVFADVHEEDEPLLISLTGPILKEQAVDYDQKLVQVRGFLYKDIKDQLILSPYPHLKSCCLANLSPQQMIVTDLHLTTLNSKVSFLQGVFYSSPSFNEAGEMYSNYFLRDTKLLASKDFSKKNVFGFILLLSGLLLVFKFYSMNKMRTDL